MNALFENLLHARTGKMTRELAHTPSEFGNLPVRLAPTTTARSICGYCSTGCSLEIHLDAHGQARNLTPDKAYPVNLGMACPKGWEALTPLAAPDRATTPLLRNRATGRLEPVDWPTALRAFVDNFQGVQQRHGRAALSVLSTGQIPMEEMAFLGSLAKFGMGVAHLDSNTRQCMATAHVAYRQSFGFDAPPFTYADFEESDVLVFVGANPCIAHPILWQRVKRNRRNPRIVVLDPRCTETATQAALHLAPYPKSDLTLLYGLARELIHRGKVDRVFVEAHTRGFAEFAAFVEAFTPERVARESGIATADLRALADIVAAGERVSYWWTMGVNQSHQSTRTAQALINLALMTGQIGRPGTGANSITGQCNAMGSRLFGNATALLAGRDFADPDHRAQVAEVLGIDPSLIPTEKSLAYDQILEAVDHGEIRGLWIIATNTAHSWVNHRHFAELRHKLEFLVVQDMYATTETAQLADLVLPAAGWGEKEGVFINSERRLGVIRRVSRAPGLALSDFAVFQLIAQAWGCGELFSKWTSPAAAFALLRELSRGQPCDFTGIRDYDHIEAAGGIQWPYTAADAAEELRNAECGMRIVTEPNTRPTFPHDPAACTSDSPPASAAQSEFRNPQSAFSERRLFADGRFFAPDERAVFLFDEPRPLPEPPEPEYPLLLNTGRGSSAQWHTGSRTDKSAVLRKLAARAQALELNPADAARHGIVSGQRVRVSSRRGDAEAVAFVTPTVAPGQIFMAMHGAAVNRLTLPNFDPHSRQPGYKACAVRIAPL
ncbi:MAG TPA: molybdopterin oxidoreductase family protein [Opitutaceae bacterium]|nr:molybdopterin oxidoreductase family protein [Opitutaceae bacterium]